MGLPISGVEVTEMVKKLLSDKAAGGGWDPPGVPQGALDAVWLSWLTCL